MKRPAAANAALQSFVRANERADLARLLLGKAPPGIDLRLAAEQIAARQKVRDKLPGWLAVDGVVMPPKVSLEQSSSQLAAGYKASLLQGAELVDLSGGMGVDCIALADGFEQATYVERDPVLAAIFAHNAPLLTERAISVVQADAEDYIAMRSSAARGITFYVDPARRGGANQRVFRFEDCSPHLRTLLPALMPCADRVLIKASPMIDLAEGCRALSGVREIHVVSIGNECKEVLFLLDRVGVEDPVICCVDLRSGVAPSVYRFTAAAERAARPPEALPGRYLYDAGSAIRKAGAFRQVAVDHGLAKLGSNTHLYTAQVLKPEFPGRIFEIEADLGGDIARAVGKERLNVIARNHPLSVEALRKRYRIREGGERFLLAFRDCDERPRHLLARRCSI